MCFSLREGPVTVASLAGPVGGSFNLFACGGEALRNAPDSGNQASIRLNMPLHGVLQRLVEHGMGHHLVAGHGDVVAELHGLAETLGMRII